MFDASNHAFDEKTQGIKISWEILYSQLDKAIVMKRLTRINWSPTEPSTFNERFGTSNLLSPSFNPAHLAELFIYLFILLSVY